jgi:hypothetical protein
VLSVEGVHVAWDLACRCETAARLALADVVALKSEVGVTFADRRGPHLGQQFIEGIGHMIRLRKWEEGTTCSLRAVRGWTVR